MDRVVRPAPNGRRTRCRRKRRRGSSRRHRRRRGPSRRRHRWRQGLSRRCRRVRDRAGGVGEDCAVGNCGAGYGQEEVEPPRDARSVPTLDVLPLTDSRASSDGLLDPPLLLCGRRSGRRGHRTLAGDAAGHEPRGTRSPAPSCSRPPPPKVRTRHPRLLHQFSVFFVMFASDF